MPNRKRKRISALKDQPIPLKHQPRPSPSSPLTSSFDLEVGPALGPSSFSDSHFIPSQPPPNPPTQYDLAVPTKIDVQSREPKPFATSSSMDFDGLGEAQQSEHLQDGPSDTALNDTINQIISEISIPHLARRCPPENTSSLPPRPAQDTKRRQHQQGTIRKLGELVTNPVIKAARASRTTLSGHRQAGVRSSRLDPDCVAPPLVLAVSRRTSFSAFLKNALDHLRTRKTGEVRLMAMGCAISMCLSLAMAIESNLELGNSCALVKEVKTGTVIVGDEITPTDHTPEESDLIYQTRAQASIEILLTLTFPIELQSLTSQLFPSTSLNQTKKEKKKKT